MITHTNKLAEIAKNLRDKETDTLRKKIVDLVEIRLGIQNIKKHLEAEAPDMVLAFEEIDKAIECLYEAESSIGNAHQHILVGTTTILTEIPTSEYCERQTGHTPQDPM